MSSPADSFSAAFGSRRGLAVAAQREATRRDREREDEAVLSAFRQQRPYAGCGRFQARGYPHGDPRPTHLFLLDDDGQLLAVSYSNDGDEPERWRLKGIGSELADRAGVPKRYEQLGKMTRSPESRTVLVQAGVLDREAALAQMALSAEEMAYLTAMPEHEQACNGDILSATHTNPPVAEGLHEMALIRLSGVGSTYKRTVSLTDEGRLARQLASAPPRAALTDEEQAAVTALRKMVSHEGPELRVAVYRGEIRPVHPGAWCEDAAFLTRRDGTLLAVCYSSGENIYRVKGIPSRLADLAHFPHRYEKLETLACAASHRRAAIAAGVLTEERAFALMPLSDAALRFLDAMPRAGTENASSVLHAAGMTGASPAPELKARGLISETLVLDDAGAARHLAALTDDGHRYLAWRAGGKQ